MSSSRPGLFARLWPHVAALLWAGVVGVAVYRDRLPAWVGWAILGLSACGFVLHAWDKWRATAGGRRVPETLLHTVELLGGWPGALVGRHFVRNKTVKVSYRVVFWLCTLTNVAVVGGVLWYGDGFGDMIAGLGSRSKTVSLWERSPDRIRRSPNRPGFRSRRC